MKKYLAFGFLALLGGAVLAYWYLLPTAVERHHEVRARPLTFEITGPGLLDAINRVIITTRIQGFLQSIGADRNDAVERGQVLAQLESADLESQLAAAQAETVAAERAIAEVESERDRASAALDQAQVEFERRTTLAQRNAISQAELVASEGAFKQAQANLARADAAIERAKAQALAAKANEKVLAARLGEATIHSPIDGVVVTRDRNPGDLLAPGSSLMQVVDVSSIIVSARFDESARAAIQPGQPARVRFAADPTHVWTGKVHRLSRQVDQETREFTVDVSLDALPESWAMGQRATVAVEIQSPALTLGVPEDFLTRHNGRLGVWTTRRGRATWVPVALGYTGGPEVEIVRGLSEGDVVLDPEDRYSFEPVMLRGPAQ